ncbi:zinc finger family protein [Trifolium pratense]|uniref:Zinc finger family protein n=1 Tax=Trifolium pratense TaxID=57577 RepID=A0A2K3PMW0_TRIPR|nr:zinc finger family protein [Trifolium pratense]
MEKNNGKACGICGKWFPSAKSIGGHMRSHLVLLPIPPKFEANNQAMDNPIHHPNQRASPLDCLSPENAARTLIMMSKETVKGDSLAQVNSQARFNCDKCGKMFRSYQALGGHKAKHRKIDPDLLADTVDTLERSEFKD